jgi:hypothetical protein
MAGLVSFSRLYMADALVELGRCAEAATEIARLESAFAPPGAPPEKEVASYFWCRAHAALCLGDAAAARRDLARALAIESAYRPRSDFDVAWAHNGLSLCAWAEGDLATALDHALRGEAARRQGILGIVGGLSEVDALAAARSRNSGQNLMVASLLAGPASTPNAVRVFDSIIRSRALVEDAMLSRRRRLRALVDPAIAGLAESLAVVRERIARVGMDPVLDNDASRDSVSAFKWRERELLGELTARDPGFAAASERSDLGLSDVAAALPGDAVLLSYQRYHSPVTRAGAGHARLETASCDVGFALDGRSGALTVADLGSAAENDSLIRSWRSLLGESQDSRTDFAARLGRLGQVLRRKLYDPLVPAGTTLRRLFVVADGSIALLPLAALPDEDGRTLLEAGPTVEYLSAERDLVPAAEPVAESGHGLLALGNPDFAATAPVAGLAGFEVTRPAPADARAGTGSMALALRRAESLPPCARPSRESFAPLPQSGAEALEVCDLARHAGIPAAGLIGTVASEPAFKRWAPGRQYLHLATHGFFVDTVCDSADWTAGSALLRSGLVLAGANTRSAGGNGDDDGFLTAEEVAGLDLGAARCVVLSACESGLGDLVAGEGVVGLRRAFRIAGARSLVTTLWKVEDNTARAWTRAFYRELLIEGAEPAEATRRASLAILRALRATGQEPDPGTWAAFVVSGAPSP